MTIRTRLIFTLAGVALVSMALLGGFAYYAATPRLEALSLRQLSALAESKKRDLSRVVSGWEARVNLIASRTQLRLSLKAFAEEGNADELRRIQRIIRDAHASVDSVKRIMLFDTAGTIVAQIGGAHVSAPVKLEVTRTASAYRSTFPASDGGVEAVFHRALDLEGEKIGGMEVVLDGGDLQNVAADYTGLGDSGETLIVMRDEARSERAILLNEPRHAAAIDDITIDATAPDVAAALAGIDARFSEGVRDYRGQLVWSATRTVPRVGWGLVVKIDTAEEIEPVEELREMLLDLGLSLSAFAIVAAFVLGSYLARPILALRDVVERIREGEVELRAEVKSGDEIGFLSMALNDFMDELVRVDRISRDADADP